MNRNDPTKAIDVITNRAETELIRKYTSYLKTVIKSVLFLGKQGLPFLGHREDGQHFLDSTNNPGNFKAFLKLLDSTGNANIKYLFH